MDTALLNSHRTDAPAPPTTDAPRPGVRLWPLLVILVLGAVLRVALWDWSQGQLPHGDELDYTTLAHNLVSRGEFADAFGPSSLRPPLYPALMAAVYGLFGIDNLQAVRLFQAALSL